MDGKATDRNYQLLASKIVEVACADYIDALIVKQQGYITEGELINKVFRKVIRYGARRYVYIQNGKLFRATERGNKNALKSIKDLLEAEGRKRSAEIDIRNIEEFFHSGTFAIFMPHTDVDWLIRQLKARAINHDRLQTGYGSNY